MDLSAISFQSAAHIDHRQNTIQLPQLPTFHFPAKVICLLNITKMHNCGPNQFLIRSRPNEIILLEMASVAIARPITISGRFSAAAICITFCYDDADV